MFFQCHLSFWVLKKVPKFQDHLGSSESGQSSRRSNPDLKPSYDTCLQGCSRGALEAPHFCHIRSTKTWTFLITSTSIRDALKVNYLSLQGGGMVFLAVSSGSLRCLCSELYRARTFARWCDPWLTVHPLQIPRCSNNPPTEPENWIFRPSHPDVFRVIFGLFRESPKMHGGNSCRLLRQSSPPDQQNFYAILSGSCEVLRILAANLRWLTCGWIFGWCYLSIYLIYLFVIFIVVYYFCAIYLYISIELIVFYLQHAHTSIYMLINFMQLHNHMTNTHTHIYRPMVIWYVRSSSHFLSRSHFEHDLYI